MLDILRKHASSWLIKVILGAIIISFAFFFGYNRMTRAKRSVAGFGSSEAVATVNGVDIPASEFRFFYERNYERMKEMIKGEGAADSLTKIARSMTLQQLVQRELLLETATKLGIRVPDSELATVIRKNPELIKDGEFDPIFYRHQYLPYFENRYGINFEELVRQDLIINELHAMFADVDQKSPAKEQTTQWTFEVASISPKKLVEEKVVKDDAEAKKIQEAFSANPKDWKNLAKKYHSDIKAVGPITISQRMQILNGGGTFEDFEKIFTLNETKPVTSIEQADTVYMVKFAGRKTAEAAPAADRKSDFLSDWMRRQMTTAKIQTFLKEE